MLLTTLLSDQIAESLRDSILDGTLSAGTKLAEEEIATRLGVSRVPLREALKIDRNKRSTNEVRKEMTMTESVEQVAEKLGLFARVGLFYRQVVSELTKVVWPTRNQLTTYTAVVLVFVGFIILVVSIFDLILTKITFWVFG